MTLRFDGRVAIVTGAGRGIGRSHALMLAERGAAVVVVDIGSSASGYETSESPAAAVVDEITASGGRAIASTDSVAESSGGEAIARAAVDAFGRIDILINNAGILRDRSFANLSDEDIDGVLRVHLYGAFNVTRPVWRIMREQGYGRVLMTTSSSGVLGTFGQANYGAAKMGVVGLMRVLALEGAKYGITVNALAPMARTRMTEEVLGDLVQRLDPDLVSAAAAWLVHEDCGVTGEVYSVAAGRVARFFTGMTRGYLNEALTPEDVRDHFDDIRSTDNFLEPTSSQGEIEFLQGLLADARTAVP